MPAKNAVPFSGADWELVPFASEAQPAVFVLLARGPFCQAATLLSSLLETIGVRQSHGASSLASTCEDWRAFRHLKGICNKRSIQALSALDLSQRLDMEESSASVRPRRSVLLWVIVALAVMAAGASFVWMNNKIEALATVKAPTQEHSDEEMRQAVATLQQRLNDTQSGQTKLTDQVSQLQRSIAAEQGERKLLSDQLGSLSGRLDALSSSSADANPSPQQPQRNRRSKR